MGWENPYVCKNSQDLDTLIEQSQCSEQCSKLLRYVCVVINKEIVGRGLLLSASSYLFFKSSAYSWPGPLTLWPAPLLLS